MGKLSTHVLDTYSGRPAAGVAIDLDHLAEDGARVRLKSVTTNGDGRTDEPLLMGAALKPGRYELSFHVGAYFAGLGAAPGPIPFLDIVPVRFGVADAAANYHVPLVVSPWTYTTYRGS